MVLQLLPPLKTGRHDIAEILLKVALNTKSQSVSYKYNPEIIHGGHNMYVVLTWVKLFL